MKSKFINLKAVDKRENHFELEYRTAFRKHTYNFSIWDAQHKSFEYHINGKLPPKQAFELCIKILYYIPILKTTIQNKWYLGCYIVSYMVELASRHSISGTYDWYNKKYYHKIMSFIELVFILGMVLSFLFLSLSLIWFMCVKIVDMAFG